MYAKRFYELFPVTSYLLLLNTIFFFLEILQHWKLTGEVPMPFDIGGIHPRVLDILGSVSLDDVRRGEAWRLVTAGFLHAGVLHILFNGLFLLDLGRRCEPLLSSWKFLVVYGVSLLGGSLGSILSAYVSGRDTGSVGASGAICGLIGVLLGYSLRERQVEMRDAILRSIFWIVIMSLVIENIDHAAHAGGFLAGFAMGLTVSDYIDSKTAPRWRYPGIAVAIVGLLCLALGLWNYFEKRGSL